MTHAAMVCPECGGPLRRVRTLAKDNDSCERLRECAECKRRYVTKEVILRAAKKVTI